MQIYHSFVTALLAFTFCVFLASTQTVTPVEYEIELCPAASQTVTETVTVLNPIDIEGYITYQTTIFTTILSP